MKAIVAIVLFFVLNISCYAQQPFMRDLGDFYQAMRANSGNSINTLSLSDVNGSPYLHDELIKGEVITSSGERYIGIKLRYNVYNDKMEYEGTDGKVFAIGDPDLLKELKIGESRFVYAPYAINKKVKKQYFQVLNEGNALLYIKHEIEYSQPILPEAYKDAQPAKFTKKNNQYYIRNELDAAILINNLNTLLSVLKDKQNEIESFIKREKKSIKKEDGLLAIVNYYNSLK